MTSLLTIDVFLAPEDRRAALAEDARAGLTGSPKRLPPVWFYDERGSQLFDEITRLPEYYLTSAERSILSAHAREIASAARADTLVELGPGQTLVDLPYPRSATAKAAAAAGATVLDGLEVLVAQGAASFELWTGVPAPVSVMRRALGLPV